MKNKLPGISYATYLVMVALSVYQVVHLRAGELPANSLQEVLESSDESIRKKTCESIIAAYRAGTDEQKAAIEAKYEGAIVAILNSPVRPQEHWLATVSARNLAIGLAGELKVTSAIPRLIELLRPLQGEVVKSYESGFFSTALQGSTEIVPAANALIQIGEPARAFLEASAEESNKLAVDQTVDHRGVEHHNRMVKLSNVKYVLQKLDDVASGNPVR